jgi:parallel beta-helix repeat protein
MHPKSNAFLGIIILFSSSLAVLVTNTGTDVGAGDRSLEANPVIYPSIAHGKISIVGNAQLTAFFAGNSSDGTTGNPYIIQGFEINSSSVGSPIYIKNTNKHIIIQQCNLRGSESTVNRGGISLDNCSNVIIRWNTATLNKGQGVYAEDSTNIRITSNTITSNDKSGVVIVYSSSVTITNNTISDCIDGVYVQDSDNVTVSLNAITNVGGIGISISSCVPPLKIGGNVISDCDSDGILLVTSYGTVIANNTIIRCDYFGINIQNSCCDNNITHNLVRFCRFAGIQFYNGDINTTGNIIWQNAFLDNTDTNSQSRWLTPGDNDWDFGGKGNYWGDYEERYPTATQSNNIWSSPYEINETNYAFDYDHFPLVTSDLITNQNPPPTPGIEVAIVIIVIAFLAAAVMVMFKAYKTDVFLPVKRR